MKKYLFGYCLIFFITGFVSVQAASLGEEVVFNVDSEYDPLSRSQVTATLRAIGDRVYFYVDNAYWSSISGTLKNGLRESLEDLADEFDNTIYPKERAVFGSEWNPGIDDDSKITVLMVQLVDEAGGYFNTYDEYSKSQVSTSNEREMVYLNVKNALNGSVKSFLAHEFQHLITFYQKTVLYGLEEEVWLNEARSEYAPTLCGYNDVYNGSYLASRIDLFLDSSSDPLLEWKNELEDYGVATLFLHYLVDHYGTNILTQTTLADRIGVESIDKALENTGHTESFSDVFADWAITNYLNDCQVAPGNKYCYLNDDMTYQRLHVDPSATYSGFPNLIVSRSSFVKNWSPRWYKFQQGTIQTTDKDTLKLEFTGSVSRGDFQVPYIITDQNSQTTVQFMSLDNQYGAAYIPNFTSLNKSVIMIPFNQYKSDGVMGSELPASFSFVASSIATIVPTIEILSPFNGLTAGGFEITIQGSNFTDIKTIAFGEEEITNFTIANDDTITFIAPAHSIGSVNIVIVDVDGQEASLTDAFTYIGGYPEGSLIRVAGGYKVYIIKGSYKRWIQSAEVFNAYAHLEWEDVIDISSAELDQYEEAWLIRADGDPRVYEVNADATKHWLDMTAEEFTISGRFWDMVYIVNKFERDFYTTGVNVMYE